MTQPTQPRLRMSFTDLPTSVLDKLAKAILDRDRRIYYYKNTVNLMGTSTDLFTAVLRAAGNRAMLKVNSETTIKDFKVKCRLLQRLDKSLTKTVGIHWDSVMVLMCIGALASEDIIVPSIGTFKMVSSVMKIGSEVDAVSNSAAMSFVPVNKRESLRAGLKNRMFRDVTRVLPGLHTLYLWKSACDSEAIKVFIHAGIKCLCTDGCSLTDLTPFKSSTTLLDVEIMAENSGDRFDITTLWNVIQCLPPCVKTFSLRPSDDGWSEGWAEDEYPTLMLSVDYDFKSNPNMLLDVWTFMNQKRATGARNNEICLEMSDRHVPVLRALSEFVTESGTDDDYAFKLTSIDIDIDDDAKPSDTAIMDMAMLKKSLAPLCAPEFVVCVNISPTSSISRVAHLGSIGSLPIKRLKIHSNVTADTASSFRNVSRQVLRELFRPGQLGRNCGQHLESLEVLDINGNFLHKDKPPRYGGGIAASQLARMLRWLPNLRRVECDVLWDDLDESQDREDDAAIGEPLATLNHAFSIRADIADVNGLMRLPAPSPTANINTTLTLEHDVFENTAPSAVGSFAPWRAVEAARRGWVLKHNVFIKRTNLL